MPASLIDTLLQLVSATGGLALALWIFWRANETSARGEPLLKLLLLLMFAASIAWVVDQVVGNTWSWDGAVLIAAVAGHCWWGAWRHTRADRRRYRAPTGCPYDVAQQGKDR